MTASSARNQSDSQFYLKISLLIIRMNHEKTVLEKCKILVSWSLKNFELDQQLSVKAFFVQDLFEKVYLVKMCPKFDGTPLVLFTRYDHFLLGCWFFFKNLPYFGYPSWKFHNRVDSSVEALTGQVSFYFPAFFDDAWHHVNDSWIPHFIKYLSMCCSQLW